MKTISITRSYDRRQGRPEIDPAVFQAIIVCCFDMFQFEGPLLPNLRSIFCDNTDHLLWNVYPFISSRLQFFQMYIEQTPGLATMTILSALPAKSPRVDHFSIQHGHFYKDALTSCISNSICGLQYLHTFHCAEVGLTCEAIIHLASLPNLREAYIHIPNGQMAIIPSLPFPFPALQHLELYGDTITPVIEFVKHLIRSASLKEFTVCVEDPPSSAQLGQIFSLLITHSSPEHLTSLHVLHPDYISFGDWQWSLLKVHDLNPLSKLTNLECISIETECSTEELDDTFLVTMANCWPKLRQIALTGGWAHCSPSQCTFRGISYLVGNCPNLTSLGIAFQASAETSWGGRPGGGVVNANMNELDVRKSPISHPRAVATFLSYVCPGLTCISAWEDFDPDDPIEADNWRRWQKTIRLFNRFVEN